MTGIIIAACAVGVTGLLLGLFLGFMGKKFAVEVDQKEIDVRAELPGNNCGFCQMQEQLWWLWIRRL